MNMATQIPQEAVELSQQTKTIEQEALDIVIEDQVTFDRASETVKQIRGLKKQIEDAFNPGIKKAHEAHREMLRSRDSFLAPLQKPEQALKMKMGVYLRQKEEEAKKREQEARELAKKQEEEQRLALAERLENEGKTEEANAILEKQMPVSVAKEPPPVAKTKGVSARDNWQFEIIDEASIPREYMMPDEKKIRGVVKALKGATKIPGVNVYCEKSVVVGA